MIKNEKYVSLDGRNNGVAIYLNKRHKFLEFKNEKSVLIPKLFRSIKLAKIFLRENLDIGDPREYSILFLIDGLKYGLEEAGIENEYYVVYSKDPETKETTKYYISEEVNDRVIEIGYLSFYDAQNSFLEKSERQQVQKDIYRATRNAIQDMLLENTYFEKVCKSNDSHLCCYLKFSSAKIHIYHNDTLINFNQERKKDGIRCLPFMKDIDGWSSLYYCVTKDVYEPDKFGSAHRGVEYLHDIVELLKQTNPELNVSLVPVEFKGDIRL